MVQFARFLQLNDLEPIHVKTVITTAERLSANQRRFLREAYGGEVFAIYGTREYGCVGFECAKHDGFHIDIESVFLEIVNDGKAAEPGESGEITITDLLNYGMPFVRSQTGDRGMLAAERCECGSPLPVLKALEGRVADVLHRPDGSMVAGLMLTDLFADLPAIEAAQFVQDNVNALDVLLVAKTGFSSAVEDQVRKQVREIMGETITINVCRVPEISRNPRSGKYQEVICRVGRPAEQNGP
jgi:phenylacetate-CoA ligase